MTPQKYFITELDSVLREHSGKSLSTTISPPDSDITYNLVYEYSPSIKDVIDGKSDKPFAVYEGNDVLYCATPNKNTTPTSISMIEIVSEKEDHDQYNAIGTHIEATILGINQNEPIKSKVDTGAECCCLGVEDIHITKSEVDPDAQKVKFTFNERTYTMSVDSMISVQTADGGVEYRPTVLFDIKIKGQITQQVPVNLNDRSGMEFKFLIGMNLLSKCGLVIDPSIEESTIARIHALLNEKSLVESHVVETRSPTQLFVDMILEHPSITIKDIIRAAQTSIDMSSTETI